MKKNNISIELIKNIHQPKEMILEENARNTDESKEPEFCFASNETVLMGDVPAEVVRKRQFQLHQLNVNDPFLY